MNIILSNLFRTICITFIYNKILSTKSISAVKFTHSFPIFSLYILCCHCIHQHLTEYYSAFSLILFVICTLFIYKVKLELSFIISIISFAIFYFVNNTCTFIIIILCTPLYYMNSELPPPLQIVFAGLLTYVALYLIFKNHLLKSTLKYVTNKKFIHFGITIGLIILFIKFIDYHNMFSFSQGGGLPLATFLLLFLLFTWWRKQITKSYIEKLRKLELHSLYDELAEKEAQIEKLTRDNESLSRIVHKDNKLIPAMEYAVTDFLSHSDFNNPDLLREHGDHLTQHLRDMTQDRRGILESYEHQNNKLKLSGHVSLDAILVYMQKKAEENHIFFEWKYSDEILEFLLTKISENDLSHLLSDLLENAIISMKENKTGRLQVVFGKLQKEAYIAVADTGSDFELSTLHSFGLKSNSTHEEDGGTGIGLMDIWTLKKKYRATIQIQEYEKNINNFSKKILFSFNTKNHYVIQSYRHAEISNTQTRGDLYVIPMETTKKSEDTEHGRNNQNLNS